MACRNGNYTAFYVAEPFVESNLGANLAHDFVYYNLLKAWKEKDSTFPFNDSHEKTYNVRDSSDWEKTLKPRLHQRLDNSQNIILILSQETKNSTALREELDYGINKKGLPIIIVYPEFESTTEIVKGTRMLKQEVKKMWDKLPVLRDNINKIPTIHVPMSKDLIAKSLNHDLFKVQTKTTTNRYFW